MIILDTIAQALNQSGVPLLSVILAMPLVGALVIAALPNQEGLIK